MILDDIIIMVQEEKNYGARREKLCYIKRIILILDDIFIIPKRFI